MTKNKIIKSALELFKTKGYEETTVIDICNSCGIAKGTFYYHFQTKSDIIYSFYINSEPEFKRFVISLFDFNGPREQLWEIINFNLKYTEIISAKLAKSFYQADMERGFKFFNPVASTDLNNYQTEIGIKLIKKGQKIKQIKEGNPKEMLYAFFSAQYGIALSWAFSDGTFDEKKEIKRVFDVIF